MKVEDWTLLLTDAKYVHGIYSQPPDVSKVSIIEVALDREASMLKCLRQPASAYLAHLSHADDAVTNKKRDSFDDVIGD